MTITFGILFHANSPFSWSFEPAFHYAYQPTVEIVGEFDLKFNWHFSATLLQMINWKYPYLIDTIIKGLEDGRYEILSSSYAQNVMYATSDWANQHHLEKNKEIVSDIFAIEAKGFWNPERVWSDKFAPWLVERNYTYTLVENQILNPEHPEQANKVHYKDVNGEKLYFLPDNQEVLAKFDEAIWTGDAEPLLSYLQYLDDTYDNPVVCYAQDSEILGYWQLSHDHITTEEIHKNLRNLLRDLKDQDWIKIDTFSSIIESFEAEMVESLPDGQASWMLNSVQYDGYQDYFDFLRTSPEIAYYKQLFDKIEKKLQNYQEYQHTDLYSEALSVYLAHQFEFGCATGSLGNDSARYLLNVPGKMLLEGTRLSNFLLMAFDQPSYQLKWHYLGNHPVIIFSNEDLYSVWTPFGARCVLLIDRNRLTTISPNPYFYNIGNSVADLELPSPTFEFPELGSSMIHGGTIMADTLVVNDEERGMPAIVRRVFSDHGSKDVRGPSLPHNYFDTQIIPFDNKIKFWIQLGDHLLQKEVSLLGDELRIKYTLSSEQERRDIVKLGVTNEVSPSPNEIMVGGTNSLDIDLGTTDYSILNLYTGAGIRLTPSKMPTNTDVIEAIFAKRLSLYFTGKVSKDNPLEVNIKLSLL